MKRVALDEFRGNALRLVARVRRTGEPIVITQYGDEVARLVPERMSPWQRVLKVFGLAGRRAKRANRCASWGVYLKMR